MGGENAGVMSNGHGHAHDHSDAMRRTAAQHVGRLWVAFALTAVFVVVWVVSVGSGEVIFALRYLRPS